MLAPFPPGSTCRLWPLTSHTAVVTAVPVPVAVPAGSCCCMPRQGLELVCAPCPGGNGATPDSCGGQAEGRGCRGTESAKGEGTEAVGSSWGGGQRLHEGRGAQAAREQVEGQRLQRAGGSDAGITGGQDWLQGGQVVEVIIPFADTFPEAAVGVGREGYEFKMTLE